MSKTTQEKQIIFYADDAGFEPFSEWINRLRDQVGRKRIFTRIDRMA